MNIYTYGYSTPYMHTYTNDIYVNTGINICMNIYTYEYSAQHTNTHEYSALEP